MSTANEGIAPVKPSLSKFGAIGKIKTPSGKTLDELSGAEIARLLEKLGIEGDWHHAGRQRCAEAYAKYVEEIGEEGRKDAIGRHLAGKKER